MEQEERFYPEARIQFEREIKKQNEIGYFARDYPNSNGDRIFSNGTRGPIDGEYHFPPSFRFGKSTLSGIYAPIEILTIEELAVLYSGESTDAELAKRLAGIFNKPVRIFARTSPSIFEMCKPTEKIFNP